LELEVIDITVNWLWSSNDDSGPMRMLIGIACHSLSQTYPVNEDRTWPEPMINGNVEARPLEPELARCIKGLEL
jgi:hypothetical protein